MKALLSKSEAIKLDEYSDSSGYLSSRELLDNAGRYIAQYIVENVKNPFQKQFIVIAGPGNNGSDGIICHHYLIEYGIKSKLLLLSTKQKTLPIFSLYSINNKHIEIFSKSYLFNNTYWYIDGIFGIGLKRKLNGKYLDVIKKMKKINNIISIDIPSGIYADTGVSAGCSINAKITLPIGYAKYGHFFNDGLQHSNNIFTLDVGFPKIKVDNYIQLIEKSDVRDLMPKHKCNINKYSRGKTLIIAGSLGYTGACILAAKSAINSGAGLIKIIAPISLKNIYETVLVEPIIKYYDDNDSCILSYKHIHHIIDEILWADSILFGPGLGYGRDEGKLKAKILKSINIPLVLDASGFESLNNCDLNINDLPKMTILTPHYNEFSKIFKIKSKDLLNDPVSAVRSVIKKLFGRVLILKGPTTIVVDTSGKIYFMNHGLKELAVAGTGDVLSGICSSVIAQGLTLDDAALYSTFLHAECAHMFSKLISNSGMVASDLIHMLPYAIDSINDDIS